MVDRFGGLMEKAERMLSVLLIEDNESDYVLTREQLAEKNFELVWAKDLAEGLKTLKERQFDAILLDLSLPDTVGLSTFDAVDTQSDSTPIIVLCGLDNDLVA